MPCQYGFHRILTKYRSFIYGNIAPTADKYAFYQAWLLRGDEPEAICNDEITNITPWQNYALNISEESCEARTSKEAIKIYKSYHYDKSVKENSKIQVVFRPSSHFIELIAELQEMMLCEIERKRIAIETNPTSNLRIGQLGNYNNHPIFRFYNHGIITKYAPHQIPVSVNTDDRGVFSTSLERELSLLAAALERETDNSPRDIYKWIDEVREMAVEQKF